MKKILFILVMLITIITANAQDKRSFFIGIQPSVTKEKFYTAGEYDVNLIPFVFQTSISKRMDIRVTTLGNYHIGDTSQFSVFGIELTAPIYLKKKEGAFQKSKGFFASPVIAFSRNILYENYETTLAIEPGYFFLVGKSFAISTQLQYGLTFFSHDDKDNEWIPHFGLKANFGFWF